MVKSTGCPSEGPKFNSNHPYGDSQLSVTRGAGGSDTLSWPPSTPSGEQTYMHTEHPYT